MPFLLLVILAVASMQTRWPEPPGWLMPLGSVLVMWFGIIVFIISAGWFVHCCKQRLQQEPERSGLWLRRYARFRRWHLIGLLVFYLLALYLAGWGWTAKYCLTYGKWTMPGAELLILLPFLAGLFLSWSRFYDIEVLVRQFGSVDGAEAVLTRWAYVGLHVRQSLILAAPPFLLLLVQQILFSLWPAAEKNDYLMPVLSGGLLAALFAGYPYLLRLLLNLKPLPTGPLRERLERLAGRLKFRCSEILVWNTHGSVATALLTGPMPFLRYVVLTDRLIDGMDEDEIEGVFAHEIGHVKHRHISFFFIFMVFSLVAFSALWQFIITRTDLSQLQSQLLFWLNLRPHQLEYVMFFPCLLGLGLYMFIVFGFLSRRCERQADLYACRNTSFPAFISALEKVVWLNGMSRNRPGILSCWRHGSIAQRVAFLEQVQFQPRKEIAFQQETGLMKWGMILGLAVLLLLIGPARIWEYFHGL